MRSRGGRRGRTGGLIKHFWTSLPDLGGQDPALRTGSWEGSAVGALAGFMKSNAFQFQTPGAAAGGPGQ